MSLVLVTALVSAQMAVKFIDPPMAPKPPEYATDPSLPVLRRMYSMAALTVSSGTSSPALRAASKPIKTAPVTEVSASEASGE